MDPKPHSGAFPVRRRTLLVGAASVLAAGGGAATWWLARGGPGAAGVRPGLGGDGVPRRHLSFGWLPPGYTSGEYALGDRRESLDANSGAKVLRVWVLQAGLTPPGPISHEDAQWTEAKGSDLVNGRPTRFAAVPGDSDGTDACVQWQWAKDSGAQVDYFDVGPNAVDVARRVAAAVRLGEGTGVRLPVTASGLPAALWLREVDGYDPGTGGGWSFSLTYATGAQPSSSTAEDPTLFVRVSQMTAADRVLASAPPQAGGPDTTVDGFPALRKRDATGESPSDLLMVWGVNGCRVSISIDGNRALDLFGQGGALDAWPHFTFNGERDRWT